jgi:transcriptional regulator with XRE-family HTH domain
MKDNRTFGDIIRQEREKRKTGNPEYSLRKFAKAVGISPTFLSKIETNEFDPPKAEKIIKMAELLEIQPEKLLAKAEKMDPELERIVTERQVELASFLRTADGMSSEQLKRMAEAAKKIKQDGANDLPDNRSN